MNYDKIESSEANINKFKLQFKNLSHVKVGNRFKGVILHDNNKFVAVLQCNIKIGYIVALEVSEQYQRQGIAMYLLELAQKDFNCNKLSVNNKNTTAIALYKKAGYTVFDEEGAMLYMEKK